MYVSKYVFSQLTSFLNRSLFNDFVRKYKGGHYVKHFTCWNQLLVMIFGQLSNRESLRDLIVALEAHQPKCYHMSTGYKACHQDDTGKGQSRQGLSDFRRLRLLHDGPGPEQMCGGYLQSERERLCVRLYNDTAVPGGLLVG